jgi:hypothetical protein
MIISYANYLLLLLLDNLTLVIKVIRVKSSHLALLMTPTPKQATQAMSFVDLESFTFQHRSHLLNT